jgi:hypothetical protein
MGPGDPIKNKGDLNDLLSMRSIRMMGLSDHVEAIIQSQRVREINLGKKFRANIV